MSGVPPRGVTRGREMVRLTVFLRLAAEVAATSDTSDAGTRLTLGAGADAERDSSDRSDTPDDSPTT